MANTYCVTMIGQQIVNILRTLDDPANVLAIEYTGVAFVVAGEATDHLQVLFPLTDGTIANGWLPKTYVSRGWVSQPGTVIATYLPVNPVHLTPPVEKMNTPYGDGATLTYGVIVPSGLTVRAAQPEPVTGKLDPNVLGYLKRGDLIEITGGNVATCPIKASRINFKKDGQWVKGWIADKFTDPTGWNYAKGEAVQSFLPATVDHLATFASGTVPPPEPPDPPVPDTLEARVKALEDWQAKIRSA